MGNSPKINYNEISQFQKSNILWLDINVNNYENTEYQKIIKKAPQISLYTFTNLDECIQKLIQIKYEKTYILVSGSLSSKFFTEIEKIEKNLEVIPIIIIFTSHISPVIKQNIIFHDKYNLFNESLVFKNFIPIKEVLKGKSFIPKEVSPQPYYNSQNTFSFESIKSSNQLILPIYLLKYLNIPNRREIYDFNCFLFDKYSKNNEMKELLEQLLIYIPIPNEILFKYYIKALKINPELLYEMNFCLEQQFCFDYDIFMKVLYMGLKNNSIETYKNKLYKSAIISMDQLNYISNSLNNHNNSLPSCICYNKSFLYLSKDYTLEIKKMTQSQYYFNGEYVLFDIEYQNNMNGENIFNIDIDKTKVLIFPFSSFEITRIEKINQGNLQFYHISLAYLGKYKNIINNTELIPETNFTQDILKTDLLDKFEMNKNIYKYNFNLENYIPLRTKENYIIAIYNITYDDINKNIRILNCDSSNKAEIFKKCQIFVNNRKINFSFECRFSKPGIYTFKLIFNDLLTSTKKLFYKCDKLFDISFEKFNTKHITDMSDMFNYLFIISNNLERLIHVVH